MNHFIHIKKLESKLPSLKIKEKLYKLYCQHIVKISNVYDFAKNTT